jgi:hypothetical protein
MQIDRPRLEQHHPRVVLEVPLRAKVLVYRLEAALFERRDGGDVAALLFEVLLALLVADFQVRGAILQREKACVRPLPGLGV